jgi:hypothetical protein
MAKVGLGVLLYGVVMALPWIIDQKGWPSKRAGLGRILPDVPNKPVEGGFHIGWSAGSYVIGLAAVVVGVLMLGSSLLDALN